MAKTCATGIQNLGFYAAKTAFYFIEETIVQLVTKLLFKPFRLPHKREQYETKKKFKELKSSDDRYTQIEGHGSSQTPQETPDVWKFFALCHFADFHVFEEYFDLTEKRNYFQYDLAHFLTKLTVANLAVTTLLKSSNWDSIG